MKLITSFAGLGHAFEKGEEYADETSVMGFSSSSREGPRKCFNGQNIWQFGWFNDRRTSVDPFQGTQLIELAPFVDYDHTYSNQVVLVSVFDIHIVYNRAKSFNAETSEYPNTATITQELNQINSELLGVLDMNQPVFKIENFMETGRTLHIQVCETYTSSTSTSPDFMLLSIGLDGPMCPNTPSPTSKTTPAPQTPSPTDATWAPTLNPTRAPSPAPTVKLPMIVLNTPSPDDLSRDTPSPSIGTPEKDVFIPENDVVMFTDPPKKPNLYDKPQISQEDPTPSPTASQDDIATPSQSMSQDDIDEDNESRNEGDFNGAKNAFNPEGETLAMIFCAASLALFTTCCMLAVFRWNQRRLDEQKRNLRILEYSASSQVKLYMQDPV